MLHVVRVPSALPDFFSGLRIAGTYAIGGAVIAEYLGGSVRASGLGRLIQRAQASYDVDVIFVAVALVGVLTALLFVVIDALARVAVPWHHLGADRRGAQALADPSISPNQPEESP